MRIGVFGCIIEDFVVGAVIGEGVMWGWLDGPGFPEDEPGRGGKGALEPLGLGIFEVLERVSTIV